MRAGVHSQLPDAANGANNVATKQTEKPRSVKQLARMGGFARAKKYTAKQRSDSARQAALARWTAYRQEQLDAEKDEGRRGRAGGERW